mgnify:CR=1 FL=1
MKMIENFEYTIDWANDQFTYNDNDYGIDPTVVVPVPPEHPDHGKTLQEIIGMTDDECAALVETRTMAQIRKHRNLLLIESDWTQGDDVPSAIKTPWAAYRQALRDIGDVTTASDVVWPTKPE